MEHTLSQLAAQGQKFTDAEFLPTDDSLNFIKTDNMKYVSWYRIEDYYSGQEYHLFQKFKITEQVMRNMGYSHICDALNTLSGQPGLVVRLFESTQINPQSCYQIWINQVGEWREFTVDDHIPIYCPEEKTKAQFYFGNPCNNSANREIWYLLLEKALAKCYGSYKGLYAGSESQILRDLTGAPVTDFPVVHIDKLQKITQREAEHINALWTKLSKNLMKGYAMSAKPRNPSSLESKRNILLNVFNKKYFLGDGIYSSHSYAVLAAKSVQDKDGQAAHLIRLRTPWSNEKWTGDWGSNKEEVWTEKLKKELNFDPEQEGNSEFWIPIRDFMHYFEAINIVKTVPGNVFNSVRLKFPTKRYPRAAVRFSCPKKGKYTIAIDQQDARALGISGLKNCPVKLSLCKLENGEFQLLSHTCSNTLRTTLIRKLIEQGEYYILVEVDNTQSLPENSGQAQEVRPIGTVNLSIYGPESCGIKVIECEEIHIIYDFLLYEGWNSYACQRIGNHIQDFQVAVGDGSTASLGIYVLAVPTTIIYALKNLNAFGVDIHMEILGIGNKEILGPEGKVSFSQHFKIDSGKTDIFILRDTEKLEADAGSNLSFKMKSVVGSSYQGTKPKGKNVVKVYEFLYYDIPEQNMCIVSRIPELRMAGLYDSQGQHIHEKDEQKEIKVRRKSVIEAANFAKDTAQLEEDDQEIFDAIKKAGMGGGNPEGQFRYKLNTPEGQVASEQYIPIKETSSEQLANQKEYEQERERKIEKLKDINQKVEEEKSRRERGAEDGQQNLSRAKSSLQFKEQPELLRSDEKKQSKSVSRPKKSILKNKAEEIDKSEQRLKQERQQALQMDDLEIARLLSLTKEEVLSVPNQKLLKLIQYTGIDAFVNLYGANQEYLQQLYQKLGTEEIEPQNTQGFAQTTKARHDYGAGDSEEDLQYYSDPFLAGQIENQSAQMSEHQYRIQNQQQPYQEMTREIPTQEIMPSRMSPEDAQYDTPTMEVGKGSLKIQQGGFESLPSRKLQTQPINQQNTENPKPEPKRELDMEVFGYQLNLTGMRQQSQVKVEEQQQEEYDQAEYMYHLNEAQNISRNRDGQESQSNQNLGFGSAQINAPFMFYTESHAGDTASDRYQDAEGRRVHDQTGNPLNHQQQPQRELAQNRPLEFHDSLQNIIDKQLLVGDTPQARLYSTYNFGLAQINQEAGQRAPIANQIIENVYSHSNEDQSLLQNQNPAHYQHEASVHPSQKNPQQEHRTHIQEQHLNSFSTQVPSTQSGRVMGSFINNRESSTPIRHVENSQNILTRAKNFEASETNLRFESTPISVARTNNGSFVNYQAAIQGNEHPGSIYDLYANQAYEKPREYLDNSQARPKQNPRPNGNSQNSSQMSTPQHFGKTTRPSYQQIINPDTGYHLQQVQPQSTHAFTKNPEIQMQSFSHQQNAINPQLLKNNSGFIQSQFATQQLVLPQESLPGRENNHGAFYNDHPNRANHRNAPQNQRANSNSAANVQNRQQQGYLLQHVSSGRNIIDDSAFNASGVITNPISLRQIAPDGNMDHRAHPGLNRTPNGHRFIQDQALQDEWEMDEGIGKISNLPNPSQGLFSSSQTNLHDPLRYGFKNKHSLQSDDYSKNYSHASSNANIPSSSFYDGNKLRALNDKKDYGQNSMQADRRHSMNPMLRVEKLSRGSKEPAQNGEKPNRASQRTDYNQFFDNVMGGSSRPAREKNLGLLGKGFMSGKSKGGIGANMFNDKSMENVNHLQLKKGPRAYSRNSESVDPSADYSVRERSQRFFGSKNDSHRKKAYQSEHLKLRDQLQF